MKRYRQWAVLMMVMVVLVGCSNKQSGPGEATELTSEDITLNNRGVALMGYFDYAAARDIFRQVVDRKPDWHHARVNLAIATLNRQMEGDEQLALGYLDEVLTVEPRHLRANFVAGILRERAGESEQAAGHFQIVREHDPEDAYAAYYLAVLQQNDDPERALELFNTAIELDPYLRSAYYGAFLLLVRSGDREAGIQMKEAYERLADNPRARLVETKYTRMGTKADALAESIAITEPFVVPAGSLFGEPQKIGEFPLPMEANLTTADIPGNGTQDIFITYNKSAGKPRHIEAGDDAYRILDDSLPPLNETGTAVLAWGDLDNDGNLDAVTCTGNNNGTAWYQAADGEWQSKPVFKTPQCDDLMLLDADHDGDLDVFLASKGGRHDIYSNNGNRTFRSLRKEKDLPFAKSGGGLIGGRLLAADLDNDRDVDLIVLNREGVPHDVLLNDRLWNYQPAENFEEFQSTPMLSATAADLDSDGQIEIYAISADGALLKWEKSGATWQSETISTASSSGSSQLSVTDFNGDGYLDLLIVDGDGIRVLDLSGAEPEITFQYEGRVSAAIPVVTDPDQGPSLFASVIGDGGHSVWHWPPGPARGKFAAFTFSGKEEKSESMRSNRSGIGTEVAVRRGSEWTMLDTFDRHSGKGQSSQPVAVGLGSHATIEYIAINWSDGVFQTELDLAANEIHHITETQRQLSSCPVLFAWNGVAWNFVSDILGVGGIGFLHGPGKYSTPRPWEFFQFPAGTLAANDGELQIKITEPMEEIALLDKTELWAYDLAPGWQMVMDERMGTGGPAVTGKALFYTDQMQPEKVVRDDGHDLTAALMSTDNKAADLGETHPRYLGRLRTSRSMTLQFPQAIDKDNGRPLLVASGWVEYPYSQTVFAAWQADEFYEPPTLEAADESGNWQVVYKHFGYPAGMPRKMSLPLDAVPDGTTQLRISGNLEIYWDRLSVAYAIDPGENVKVHQLELLHAQLEQTGYPERTNETQRRPQYDYDKRMPFWDARYPKGHYTRIGEVMPLMTKTDGAFVIIGPGEEVQINFADARITNSDWTREHVLFTAGYAKDMDMYTQDSGTVGPIPESVNSDLRLHQKYNTRYRDSY